MQKIDSQVTLLLFSTIKVEFEKTIVSYEAFFLEIAINWYRKKMSQHS